MIAWEVLPTSIISHQSWPGMSAERNSRGPAKLEPSSHSKTGLRRAMFGTLTHASKLNPSFVPRLSALVLEILTPSVPPLNTSAWPTNPFVKTGFPVKTPRFVRPRSSRLRSKGHQPARPSGRLQPEPEHLPAAPAVKIN